MFVCLYACMFVCLYVMLLLLDALHLGSQTFRGSFTTPRSGRRSFIIFEIDSAIVDRSCVFSSVSSLYGKASLHVTITASITSSFQETINILTAAPSTKAYGYFCDNVLYIDILQSHTHNQVISSGVWKFLRSALPANRTSSRSSTVFQ